MRASEQDPGERARWWEQVEKEDFRELVFIDETGTNIGMARRYARSPSGERVHGSVPRNYQRNTLICSLGVEGMGEAMVVEGAVDREAFLAYLDELLCPSLKAGQLVVMDNLSVHKGREVQKLIEEAGARVLFLPAYSPDFSPIEMAISKLKECVRSAGARTREALIEAIGEALSMVTNRDALGYFAHCGYSLPSLN